MIVTITNDTLLEKKIVLRILLVFLYFRLELFTGHSCGVNKSEICLILVVINVYIVKIKWIRVAFNCAIIIKFGVLQEFMICL